MIKLFILDLDGCVTEPFKTPDWDAITRIRDLNRLSREKETVPPITICTGRPHPYAEAVAQWLDIRLPFIFESAGMYDWDKNKIITGLNGDEEDGIKLIRELKDWLRDQIRLSYPKSIPEFSKMMDAGIVSPDILEIDDIYLKIMDLTTDKYPGLEVHRTDVSVNILIKGNNKLRGVQLLSNHLGIELGQMAYIGDSGGDIPAMQVVARPFSPVNAIDRVKQVSTVIPLETTKAVLQAYEMIIEENEQAR